MVTITVYDGGETIGGNKIYVEEGERGLFLDFGKNFSRYSQFYEEYLKNRTTRGIHDLLQLGLIPPLPVYRQDLIPSDLTLPPLPEMSVSAVLLSHAHLDHCGNLGLLDPQIPVVATPMSVAILKAMQDTGKSSTESDTTYISVRAPLAEEPLYLEVERGPYQGKDFFCTCPPSEELLQFLGRRPGQDGRNAKKIEPGICTHFSGKCPPFTISAYEVDHSIYGACGYVVRGDTTIAYSGDFRVHGRQAEKTRDFIHHAKEASVLIIEGTRVPREDRGDSSQVTEQEVIETCRSSVEPLSGLVLADFSARNIERMEAFSEIAAKCGRELVITAKDAYMLHAVAQVDGIPRWKEVIVYDEITEHSKRKWEGEVVRTLPGIRYVTHQEIHENPGGFLVCFSFFDLNHLLDIRPSGGHYLYSSCEPFNEEMEIDFRRLLSWLSFFRISPLGFRMIWNAYGDCIPVMERGFHASGHASADDILRVIEAIDPDHLIPVHTQAKWWFKNQFESMTDLRDGESVVF